MSELAFADRRLDEALRTATRAEALEREVHPDGPHPHVADAVHTQGIALRELGRLDEAAERLQRAIEMREALGDPRVPGSTTLARGSYSQLAIVRMAQGARAEARQGYERALELDLGGARERPPGRGGAAPPPRGAPRRSGAGPRPRAARRGGPDPRHCPDPAGAALVAGRPGDPAGADLLDLGRVDEAEASIRDAIELLTATYGAQDPRTVSAGEVLAEVQRARP